jgi:sugar/nucleoside kinase (ribokinase family)
MPVHVVGNVCIDTTFRVDRFPQPGETLNARGHMDSVGGKGANQAVAAARTGADVRFFAAVGTDPAAAFIRERLKVELDLRQLSGKPLPSDRSTILVNRDGENLIISGIDCAADFDPLRDLLLEDGAVDQIPAVKAVVVDTSGAGDIFCGCLAGCLMKGWTLAQSARIAVAAAALAVGRPGTLEACPSRAELTELMNTAEAESL